MTVVIGTGSGAGAGVGVMSAALVHDAQPPQRKGLPTDKVTVQRSDAVRVAMVTGPVGSPAEHTEVGRMHAW